MYKTFVENGAIMYGLWSSSGFNISAGSLYICNCWGAIVPMSTIVETVYVDYINDFVTFKSTCGNYNNSYTINNFQKYFEPYIPKTVDEALGYSGSKCECGLFTTLGRNVEPWQHSDYCPLYSKKV